MQRTIPSALVRPISTIQESRRRTLLIRSGAVLMLAINMAYLNRACGHGALGA
jgi:hypothetical protein